MYFCREETQYVVKLVYSKALFSKYKYLRKVICGSNGKVIAVSLTRFSFLAKVYPNKTEAMKEANLAYSFSKNVSSFYQIVSL